MTSQMSELVKIWTFRLSLGTALIVAILSWINGVRFFDLTVRIGVSFGVIYLLLNGIFMMFQRTALPKSPSEKTNTTPDRGGLIDFSVGDEVPKLPLEDPLFPGQVDPSLSTGLSDSKRQADIVRRMGWD